MKIAATHQDISASVKIGKRVHIQAEKIVIRDNAVIEDDVSIKAKEIYIGCKTIIQKNCSISAIGEIADRISFGDYGFIGSDTRILVPVFEMGDYTAIHNHALINGYKPCYIGHNSFIGQHSVLNSSETLLIGNNFRMSLNGYVWTHAESGELLEGCNFYHRTSTVIEDNVWLAGSNVCVSPGVRLRQGCIILMGSVVTKDTLPRHCYGGVPARDLTEQLKPYKEVTVDEKIAMLKTFVGQFIEKHGQYSNGFEFISYPASEKHSTDSQIVIIENGPIQSFGDGVSVFCLSTKTYVKQRTQIEEDFMRFLIGARARFVPDDRQHVIPASGDIT